MIFFKLNEPFCCMTSCNATARSLIHICVCVAHFRNFYAFCMHTHIPTTPSQLYTIKSLMVHQIKSFCVCMLPASLLAWNLFILSSNFCWCGCGGSLFFCISIKLYRARCCGRAFFRCVMNLKYYVENPRREMSHLRIHCQAIWMVISFNLIALYVYTIN